jgi:hypothetical protein
MCMKAIIRLNIKRMISAWSLKKKNTQRRLIASQNEMYTPIDINTIITRKKTSHISLP